MYRILIVDDEPSVRELYRLDLEDAGFEVETAANSAHALAFLQRWSPDLVALDIKLDQENGLDLLHQIVDTRSMPTILMSGYPVYRNDFTSWLANAFLIKSCDTKEFREKIVELIGAARSLSDRVLKLHHGSDTTRRAWCTRFVA